MHFLLNILLYLPSITFGLLRAEIFPWAILIWIARGAPVRKRFFTLFLFILIGAIISFMIQNFKGILSIEPLRSSAAYINALAAFSYILTCSRKSIMAHIRFVKYLWWFLLIFGILQISGLIVPLDGLIRFIVPRASASSLAFMNRGVTLLSSEPARAGNELIFIYIFIRFFYLNQRSKIAYDLFMLLYLLLVVQSSMAFGLFLVFLFLNYPYTLLLFPLVYILLISLGEVHGRAFQMIRNILDMDSLSSIWFYIVNSSGHRIISIYSSFKYGILNPLGGGVGMWEYTSIDALKLSGVNLSNYNYFNQHSDVHSVSIRSSGFLSNAALDMGMLGVYLTLRIIWKEAQFIRTMGKDLSIFFVIFLLKIFFIGSVGHPLSWIILALFVQVFKLGLVNSNNLK